MNRGFSRFLTIWVGELLSTVGLGMTAFALGVYLFQLTGEATPGALIVLSSFLPGFFVRPFGGTLADRIDRRLLMIIGNAGAAAGTGMVILTFALWESPPLALIYPGVVLNSLFVGLHSPAYKASVTDLCAEEEYARASGLMQISQSAGHLLAPVIAGLLMAASRFQLLLFLDAGTSLLAALIVLTVRSGISSPSARQKKRQVRQRLRDELRAGIDAVFSHTGIRALVLLMTLLMLCVGFLQTLVTPMALAFTDEKSLGAGLSVCASGMLFGALFIGIGGAGKKHFRQLVISLLLMGLFFALIGIKEDILALVLPGFLFFVTLPFINTSVEVLIRKNIPGEKQGRAWGVIGSFTFLGAIIAYAVAGPLADHIFNPLLLDEGALASTVGRIFGVGAGRGIALMFFLAGVLGVITALAVGRSKTIRGLEGNKV